MRWPGSGCEKAPVRGAETPQEASRAGGRGKVAPEAVAGSEAHPSRSKGRAGRPETPQEASEGVGRGRVALQAAQRRPERVPGHQVVPKPGRKPGGRLRIDDEATFEVLAERTLGLTTNLIVLDELECTEEQLIRFMKKAKVMAKLQRRVSELRQSGELARRRANVGLNHGVTAMSEIVQNPELGPSARIGAASTLSKIASNNGKQQSERESGPRFSIQINLGGESLQVDTAVPKQVHGEVIDD